MQEAIVENAAIPTKTPAIPATPTKTPTTPTKTPVTSNKTPTTPVPPPTTTTTTTPKDYNNLIDIRNVRLREGASRLDNAIYFLEQIKNPHKFRVGIDVVEIHFTGEESLSDVLARHFSRKIHL